MRGVVVLNVLFNNGRVECCEMCWGRCVCRDLVVWCNLWLIVDIVNGSNGIW